VSEKKSAARQYTLQLCEYLVKWCEKEKRTYLKNRIQIKLANLYWLLEKYQTALEITDLILEDVRKADDKHILVEIELVNHQIHLIIQ
jgi:26S proteasome regulatory subunit N6